MCNGGRYRVSPLPPRLALLAQGSVEMTVGGLGRQRRVYLALTDEDHDREAEGGGAYGHPEDVIAGVAAVEFAERGEWAFEEGAEAEMAG